MLTLFGPSGGGKSTLLRLVNGLEARSEGELRVLDQEVPEGEPGTNAWEQFWRPIRRRIGFVFQAFHLYPHLRALENVALAPRVVLGRDREASEAQAEKLLERVGLRDKLRARPRELSGGQQQRVAIARALATDPEILCFDEPTSALDPEMSAEVLAVMRDLAVTHERTLLVVTHELGFAREVADRLAFLAEGALLEIGPPAEVLDAPQDPRTVAFLSKVPGVGR